MELDLLAAKLRLAWYDYLPVVTWDSLSPHVKDKWRRVARAAIEETKKDDTYGS